MNIFVLLTCLLVIKHALDPVYAATIKEVGKRKDTCATHSIHMLNFKHSNVGKIIIRFHILAQKSNQYLFLEPFYAKIQFSLYICTGNCVK